MPIRFFTGSGGDIVGQYGTFVPILRAGGSALGQTYTTQVGSYYRIGRVINFTLNMAISAKTAATGALTITGMPDYAEDRDYVNMMTASGLVVASDQRTVAVQIGTTNYITLYAVTVAGVRTAMTNTNVNNTSNFTVTGAYLTNI